MTVKEQTTGRGLFVAEFDDGQVCACYEGHGQYWVYPVSSRAEGQWTIASLLRDGRFTREDAPDS